MGAFGNVRLVSLETILLKISQQFFKHFTAIEGALGVRAELIQRKAGAFGM